MWVKRVIYISIIRENYFTIEELLSWLSKIIFILSVAGYDIMKLASETASFD